jgi:hypothetical protein
MRVSKYSHDQQSANGNSPLKFSGSLQNAKLIQIPFSSPFYLLSR